LSGAGEAACAGDATNETSTVAATDTRFKDVATLLRILFLSGTLLM
jgi:hypothetical protein